MTFNKPFVKEIRSGTWYYAADGSECTLENFMFISLLPENNPEGLETAELWRQWRQNGWVWRQDGTRKIKERQ